MKFKSTLAVLMLILVLAMTSGTARGDMLSGSIVISALWSDMNDPDISVSTTFTPFASAPGTMVLAGGSGDFAGLGIVLAKVDQLDIKTPMAWTFDSWQGSWKTTSFANIAPLAPDGFLDFFLTGVFTPNPTGLLSGFDATSAEMRISLNQSGPSPSASWSGSMNMVPEPTTMSLMCIGGLSLLRRRRGK